MNIDSKLVKKYIYTECDRHEIQCEPQKKNNKWQIGMCDKAANEFIGSNLYDRQSFK